MHRALAMAALLVLGCVACATVETAPTDNRLVVARRFFDEAQRLHAAGQYTQAVAHFERAFSLSEEHLRQEVPGLSETHLANLLNLLRADEERLYSLVRAHPDDARVRHLALSAALLRKNRFIQELTAVSRGIDRGLAPSDLEAFERLRAFRAQLAMLSLVGPGQLSPVDYQQRLEDLANQGDTLEADLFRRSAPLRALHAPPLPSELIARISAALPNDGVLVELVTYRDLPRVPQPGSESPSEPRYLALLLFPDGRTQAFDLGPAAPIDRAAVRLREALAHRATVYLPAAQELHALAFRPLVPLLGKVRRLFLAPDSQLAFVPFAALHDGRQFLLDTFDITYLTSGTDVLPRPDDILPARSIVVLADPALGSPPSAHSLPHASSTQRSDFADQPWMRIPAMWNTRSGRSGTPVPEQAEQSERQRRWPGFTSPPSWPGSNSRQGCAPTRPRA